MDAQPGYLLDTNVVLHLTRQGSPFAHSVDQHFGLSTSPFRPAICEVSIGELKAFALSATWGTKRRELLDRVIADLLVIPVSEPGVYDHWAALHSHAKQRGLPIQHDHNDLWIAAAAHVTGLQLLTTDHKAFLPLRGTPWVDVTVLDVRLGLPLL